MTHVGFADHFDGPDLDPDVWLPHYLPAWSSRAATRATYSLRDSGLHPFRDPAIVDDFGAVRVPIDVSEFHSYAVDWQPGSADFYVDDELIRSCAQSPDHPMQMMVAVFDFPERAPASDVVPELVVDHLRVSSAGIALRGPGLARP